MPADIASKTNELVTMKEMVELSGLSEHTLRYYEKIGLIKPIERDNSSKHRLYHEEDTYRVITLACLRATGMSIDQMHRYFELNQVGVKAAKGQIELFNQHKQTLINRMQRMEKQLGYLDGKIAYWEAISDGDDKKAKDIGYKNFEKALELNQDN